MRRAGIIIRCGPFPQVAYNLAKEDPINETDGEVKEVAGLVHGPGMDRRRLSQSYREKRRVSSRRGQTDPERKFIRLNQSWM